MKIKDWISNNSIPIMAVVLFGFWALGYFFIGFSSNPAEGFSLSTSTDLRIPFKPIFIFPYLALYPIFLMPFFLVKDKFFFRVFASAYITVMVFCYLIYWNFPVVMSRGKIQGTDLACYALSIVYNNDPLTNCFPSMHAAMAMMASLTLYAINRLYGLLSLLATIFLGISALLIKQHYLADILGGFGIAAIIYYAYFKQRIHETLSRDFKKINVVFEQYVEDFLEKRLESIIDRRVEQKLKEMSAALKDPSAPPNQRPLP